MDAEDREQIEQVLSRISRESWDDFLASEEGRALERRIRITRDILREIGEVARGAPPKPTREVVDLLGHRLLSDGVIGPWLRHQLLLTLPATKWERLAEQYRLLAGRNAEELHGNATQEGRGSRVMADYWRQGTLWAEEFCDALGLPPVLATRRENPLPEDEVITPAIALPALHDFQEDVYRKLRALLEDGAGQTALLSLPTGAGKTRVAVEAICDHLATHTLTRGGRDVVLWIAQSHELQMQAWTCFRQVWQTAPARTKPIARRVPLSILRAWGGRNHETLEIADGPTVLIASIDQLASWARKRREFFDEFPSRRLACVVIDEAHGLITSEHRDVLVALRLRAQHHWRPLQSAAPVLGLTATPWRSQEAQNASLQGYFQRNLITPKQLGARPIETLQKRKILTDVSWERLRVTTTPAMTPAERKRFDLFRDLPLEYLERLGAEHRRNARIVERLLSAPRRTRGLVFACSVEHAEVLTLALNRAAREEIAAVVTSRTTRAERVAVVERFRAGDSLRFLCNFGVLTTGFDAPKADLVCVTRPTTSAVLYEQMVGRGLRGERNGGTPTCCVLDVQDKGLPVGIQSYARVKREWDAEGRPDEGEE